MRDLNILVGFPNSGKSTFARYLQVNHPKMYKVAADDLCEMLYYKKRKSDLDLARSIMRSLIPGLLLQWDVVVDDVNLSLDERKKLLEIGRQEGVNINIYHLCRSISECLGDSTSIADKRYIESLASQLDEPSLKEDIDALYKVKFKPSTNMVPMGDGQYSQLVPDIVLQGKNEVQPVSSMPPYRSKHQKYSKTDREDNQIIHYK